MQATIVFTKDKKNHIKFSLIPQYDNEFSWIAQRVRIAKNRSFYAERIMRANLTRIAWN